MLEVSLTIYTSCCAITTTRLLLVVFFLFVIFPLAYILDSSKWPPRCKAYGHRTGDAECPLLKSGNLVSDAHRQAMEDPMCSFVAKGVMARSSGVKEARRQQLQAIVDEMRRENREKKKKRKEKKKSKDKEIHRHHRKKHKKHKRHKRSSSPSSSSSSSSLSSSPSSSSSSSSKR